MGEGELTGCSVSEPLSPTQALQITDCRMRERAEPDSKGRNSPRVPNQAKAIAESEELDTSSSPMFHGWTG